MWFFFFSSRRRHTRLQGDWSSDVCSSDLKPARPKTMSAYPLSDFYARPLRPEEQPRVSVITPVYNGEEFLSECIESVLAQSYQNWDYTIVNNCSTDNFARERFQIGRAHV